MKLVLKRKELADVLSYVNRLTTTKVGELYTQSFYFISKDNNLSIIGCDSVNACKVDFKDFVELEDCKFLIRANTFTNIVNKLKSVEITLNITEKSLTISDNNNKFRLAIQSTETYPQLDFNIVDNYIDSDFSKLKKAYNDTKYAVALKHAQEWATGINFDVKDKVVQLQATDSFRIARSSYDIDSDIEMSFSCPTKAMELLNLIDSNNQCQIALDNNIILFKVDNITILSRKLVGTAPNFDKVIPIGSRDIKINREEFINVLETIGIVGVDNTNSCKIYFEHKWVNGNSKVVLSSQNSYGEAQTELQDFKSEDTTEFKMCFKADNLLNILKTCSDTYFTLGYVDTNRPFAVYLTDENRLNIVSPLRSN